MAWNISYTLNKSVICPDDKVLLNLEITNPDKEYYLFIDEISLESPSNFNYKYDIKNLVPPDTRQMLTLLSIPIPANVKGKIDVELHVKTSRLTFKQNSEIDKFDDLGILMRRGPITLQIFPTPCYRAFVSRSIAPVDKPIVEPIVKMVQDWGFETITVGINSFAEQHRNPTDKIIEDIIKSDCLIAIATVRDQSAFTGLYTTLQWLHSEVSFAYLAQKPILLITDNNINLQGILEQKKWPVISFTMSELKKLQYELDEILPLLRSAIKEKKTKDFESFIQDIQKKAALGGYLAGLEQKRIEDSSSEGTLFDK